MLHTSVKGITKCSNMVANILPTDPSPQGPLGLGSIGQNSTFSDMVMLHIKLNGITKCSTMLAILRQTLPLAPATLRGLGQKVKFIFSEHSHFAYQINGNHEFSNMVANIYSPCQFFGKFCLRPSPSPPPPPTLGIGSIGQNSFFQNMVMSHIKLKGS